MDLDETMSAGEGDSGPDCVTPKRTALVDDEEVAGEFTVPLNFADLSVRPRASGRGRPTCFVEVIPVDNASALIAEAAPAEWWDRKSEHFVAMYSLVVKYKQLDRDDRRALVQAMCRALRTLAEVLGGHLVHRGARALRNALKVVALFASNLASVGEKSENDQRNGGGRPTWSWGNDGRDELLGSMHLVLEQPGLKAAWGGAEPEASFLTLFSGTAVDILESEPAAKSKATRRWCLQMVVILVRRYELGSELETPMLRLLLNHEHSVVFVSKLLDELAQHPESSASAVRFLRAVAAVEDADMGKDGAAGKNIGSLLIELGAQSPLLVRDNSEILLALLDNESYRARNGLVEALAQTIRAVLLGRPRDASTDPAGITLDEWAASALTTIVSRATDVNAFARSRTLQVLSGLVSEGCLPLANLVDVAMLAQERVYDRTAAVRKSSLQLCSSVLTYNPFGPVLSPAAVAAAASVGQVDGPRVGELADELEQVCTAAKMLLRSKSVTDVQAAVGFLVTASKFQLEGAEGSARKMLPLVLSHDQSVRECALRAFESMLCGDEEGQQARALGLAHRMVQLARGASFGELACLGELMSSERFADAATTQVLVDVLTLQVPNVQDESRLGAAALVGMVAAVQPAGIRSRGLGLAEMLRSESDPLLCRHLCDIAESTARGDGPVAASLEALLTDGAARRPETWLPLAERAIRALFRCSADPARAAERVVHTVTLRALRSALADDLICAIFCVGHVAIQQVIWMESTGLEIRKRQQQNQGTPGKGIAEQLGADSAALEAEIEEAVEGGERELLQRGSIVREALPLITRACADETSSPALRATAAMSLCKVMCVNERICRDNLRLAFSLLSRAPETTVRRNIAVAMGDLAFRFPNLLEPWTEHIFSALEDADPVVRRNMTLTITHLILNDMLRVRGQLASVVLRLYDDDTRTSELARVFFVELSKKSGHAIYNITPDVLSGLLRRENVAAEVVRGSMQFLIGFVVDKERQAESTIEKLCHRLRAVEDVGEARHIAFCLSLFNYSERCFRKLQGMLKCYAHLIGDKEVAQLLLVAANKARRAAKDELRAEVDAFVAKLAVPAANSAAVEDAEVDVEDVSRTLSRVALQERTGNPGANNSHGSPARKRSTRRPKPRSDAEPPKRPKSRATAKSPIESSEDETASPPASPTADSDKENAPQPPESTPRVVDAKLKRRPENLRSAGRSRRRRFVVAEENDSEGESDDDYTPAKLTS